MTAEARVSLDRTMGLSPESWMKVRAAVTYRKLGDVARAGAVAEGALPAIRDRLAQVTPEGLDESDLYWMDRLLDAWRLAGEAAGAGGDLARAQRYLEAAWHVGLQPEAAWLLGEVREKQGRPAQAVELWRLSASVRSPAPLPLVRAARLKAAADKLALEPAALPDPALMTLRTVRLAGPALASLAEEVLLLVNADGHVQRVSNLSRRDAEAFERQLPQLGRIRIGWPLPDAEPVKLVRRGVLACEAGQGCQLVLDLPGGESVGGRITGWVSITALEPGRDAVLKRGQQVSLTVTVRYRIDVDTAVAALVVQDQRGRRLADGKVTQVLRSRSGEATLKGTFTVPGKATEVYVLVPISSNGDSATTIVDAARFRAQGP
jgi:hypothetical protein